MNPKIENDDHFDISTRETIRRIRNSVIPEESLRNSMVRVLEATQPGWDYSTTAPKSRKPDRRRSLLLACGLSTVVAASLFVLLFSMSSREGFAGVVQALLEQEWVHVKIEDSVGEKSSESEVWFSPSQEFYGRRDAEWIELHDRIRKFYFSYNRREKQLFKMPDEGGRVSGAFYSKVFEVMRALFAEEEAMTSLAVISEIDDDLRGMKLVEMTRVQVTKDGRRFSEYRIEANHPRLTGPLSIVFSVDTETKLPHSTEVSGTENGRPFRSHALFDYPKPGPTDIFSLGVPRDTPLVNNVLRVDASAIVNEMQAGRQRFDDHRAISVSRIDNNGGAWWSGNAVVFYRKGDMYRVDFPIRPTPIQKPSLDEDPNRWWERQVSEMTFIPKVILRGNRAFWFKHDGDKNDVGPNVWVDRIDENYPYPFGSDCFLPPYFGWAPEFICRPAMGIPDWSRVVTLKSSPLENAPDAILMHLEPNTGKRRASNSDMDMQDSTTSGDFWVDPSRGCLVVMSRTQLIEEFAQTPAGHWYPKRVRNKKTVRFKDGTTLDSVRSFYLDFDTDLSDSLFDPDAPWIVMPRGR